MSYVIRLHETGGPEKLLREEGEVRSPGPGEVLVRNTAIGLNFIDTYHRSGFYPIRLPQILGSEGAGIIEAIGANVKGFKLGDRVGYVDPIGSYAQVVIRPAQRVVKLPSHVDNKTAAALMAKGLTVFFLLYKIARPKRGDTILIHAAAGGVGLILCQWANSLGIKVIGVVGSAKKAPIAKNAGCSHVIINSRNGFSSQVRKLTKNAGVRFVYDGVGKDTFIESLECLGRFGMMISIGNSSGAVTGLDILELARKGSLFLTRPSLFHYIEEREDLLEASKALFSMIRKGIIKPQTIREFPLDKVGRAHRELESRKTVGSTILIP